MHSFYNRNTYFWVTSVMFRPLLTDDARAIILVDLLMDRRLRAHTSEVFSKIKSLFFWIQCYLVVPDPVKPDPR